MSLLGTIGTAVGLAQEGKGLFGKVSGLFGGGGPNIAKSLSRQVGCTILQADANQARALMAKGINPCTGQNQIIPSTGPVGPRPAELGFPVPSPDVIKIPARPKTIQAGMIPPIGGGMSAIGAIAKGAGGLITRTIGGAGAGLIRTATGRISSIVLASGQRFSRKNAAALIRKHGLEVGAVALGIGAIEAAEILLADTEAQSRRRRGRGITAAQLRNAKRVNCTVKRMAHDLGVKPAAPRRRTCR